MLLSSSLDLVKYINPNLFYYYLPKPTALSYNCPRRKGQLTNASSASQDMKGKSTKEEDLSFTFFSAEFPAHQKYTAKGQKDRDAKKIAALSPSQSYKQLHNNIRLEKPLSRL